MAGRFRKAYVAGNNCFKQVFGEAAAHFVFNFASQAIARVIHGQHYTQQRKIGVESFFHLLVGLQQLDDAFKCKKFALQGNEQFA